MDIIGSVFWLQAILGGEESHDHNSHNHDTKSVESIEKTAIWRGLATLGGIFLFFIAERLLGVLTVLRRQKKEAKVCGKFFFICLN